MNDHFNLRTLILHFSTPIAVSEIPFFRGAIICATGGDNLFYHNHDNILLN